MVQPQLVQRGASVTRRKRLVPLGLEAELEHPDDLWLVVDHQHAAARTRWIHRRSSVRALASTRNRPEVDFADRSD